MKIFEKMEPVEYVRLNEKEYRMEDIIKAIRDMLETDEDDRYGDYSLRDYELTASTEIYDNFVKMGLVKHYIGSREARLYCMAKGAEEKLTKMLHEFYNYLDKKRGDD